MRTGTARAAATNTDTATARFASSAPSAAAGPASVKRTSRRIVPCTWAPSTTTRLPRGEHVARHLGGGEEAHRAVQRDHVASDLAGDRDGSAEHDDVALRDALNGGRAGEHHDLADHRPPGDQHVARQHHLVGGLLPGRGRLRERRARPGDGEQRDDHEEPPANHGGILRQPLAPPG